MPAGRGRGTIQVGRADHVRAGNNGAGRGTRLADERGQLAARLLESLDADADADAADAWDEEIRTRLEDVRSGRVTPVPWAKALRQIEADDGPD